MIYKLIPGVLQDHKGRYYQLARYPSGKLIEIDVSPAALSPATQRALETVEVESRSRLVPGDPTHVRWVQEALNKGSLYQQGETYLSLACYQGRNI